MKIKNQKSKIKLSKLPVLVAVVVLILAISLIYIAIHQNQTVSSGVIPSTTANQKSSSTSSKDSSSSNAPISSQSSQPTNNSSTTSNSTATTSLVAPSGTFVSNHRPNLSGSPSPSQEQSTCNTTPGATCYIEFTSSNRQIKTLTAQTTSNDGSAIWTWDVKQAGFTVGEWQITAIASLNGSTKSTTDSLKLNVQP